MTTIINLCPHAINIVDAAGNSIADFPPSGQVARCEQTATGDGTINGIPVTRQHFGEITGLPEAQTETFYIVSRIVFDAAKGRHDLLMVGPAVRNESGQVIGAVGFSR